MYRNPFAIAAALLLLAGCSKDQPTSHTISTPSRIFYTTVYGSVTDPANTIESIAADGSDKKLVLHGVLLAQPRGGMMLWSSNVDPTIYYGRQGEGMYVIHPGLSPATGYYPLELTLDGQRIIAIHHGNGVDSLMIGNANPVSANWTYLGVIKFPDNTLALSPDGRQLAYYYQDEKLHSDHGSIYVVGLDGANSHTVVSDIEMEIPPRIDWSPDGSRLLFATTSSAFPTTGGDLYTVNTDGSDLRNLTNDPLDQVCGAWSPDGTKIAFTQGGSTYDLVTMNADGSGRHVLVGGTRAAEFFPLWSPDGNAILFTEGVKQDTPLGSEVEWGGGVVRVVSVANGAVSTIATGNSSGYWAR
jgi:tricorn protease-like protein